MMATTDLTVRLTGDRGLSDWFQPGLSPSDHADMVSLMRALAPMVPIIDGCLHITDLRELETRIETIREILDILESSIESVEFGE